MRHFSEVTGKHKKGEESAKLAITNTLHTVFHIGNSRKPENAKPQSTNQIFR